MPLDLGALAAFPLWSVRDGACTCKDGATCERAGKHPMFPWSQLEKGEKWGGPPGCGYGIATGTRSGVFVVDLDVRPEKNGIEAFMAMGPCAPTYTVRTPTGGLHLYFSLPDFLVRTSGNELAPGVDIRGEGGYVVAQDSPHKNGGTYSVLVDVPIIPAPDWLLAWPGLKGHVQSSRDASANAPIPIDPFARTEEYNRRLKVAIQFLEEAPAAIDGAQGSTCLFRVCMELVRTLELPLDSCMKLLKTYYNDRCQPPWSNQELEHKLLDARDKSERMPGPVPETWSANMTSAATPAVFKNLPALGEDPLKVKRRVHDPGHKYEYTPGVQPAAGDMSKRVSSEIAFILASNEKWRGVLAYDEFREIETAIDPPLKLDAETTRLTDSDVSHIRMYLQYEGVTAAEEDIRAGIKAAAKRCTVHPIKDYLETCRGKNAKLLDTAATVLFGTHEPYACDFLKKTMISAVRRIYKPGTQVDTMLVLVGPQEGEGKSSFIRVLFGDEYTKSQMADLASERASHGLKGFWCVEMGELSRLSSTQRNVVWEFLTRRVDDYHAPYGHEDVHRPRSVIFIGTTNDSEPLTDAGDNRRFYPVTVQDIDLAWLAAHRDELWAEALELAEAGEPHWYAAETWRDIQKSLQGYKQEDLWHGKIKNYLHGKKYVTVSEIYEYCVSGGSGMSKAGKAEQMRIADTLKRAGCKNVRVDGAKSWKVPEGLSILPAISGAQEFANRVKSAN